MKKLKTAVALALCMAMLLCMTGCTESFTYRGAKNHYNVGEYEEAIEKFQRLGDYGDSQEMIQICYYELGREAMLDKEYEIAIKWFSQSTYDDAAEKLQECRNRLAQQQGE